jgi:hypothetical protein
MATAYLAEIRASMAFLPLSALHGQVEDKDMTAILLLTLLLVLAGVLGNLGLIKSNYDPDVPQDPFIRHS